MLGASRLVAPAETRQFFRIIDEQADRMNGLLADLLDAGRIDAGTLSVSPEPSEVGALVDQARNTFLSGGTGHVVLVDLPPELPRVLADRQRIAQVLNNLLSNAARHSPETAPIRIAAERDGVNVTLSVSDAGRGVAPEQLPRLFQKYSRGSDGTSGLGGGLGLAICKGLVEAHGGRIRAESGGLGQGTRFAFTIPVAEETGAADGAAPGRAAAPRTGGQPSRILVVDDDPQTLRYVRDTLADAGYAALVTGEHADLARIIQTEKPQLVLLDLILPGTDGIELMQTVPELADLPVIFISGYGRDERSRGRSRPAPTLYRQTLLADQLVARIRAGRDAGPTRSPWCWAISPSTTTAARGPACGRADGDRVRAPPRALAQCRTGIHLRYAAAPGLGRAGPWRPQACAGHRQAPPTQARRRRGRPGLHLQRTRGRLPHGPARRTVRALLSGSTPVTCNRHRVERTIAAERPRPRSVTPPNVRPRMRRGPTGPTHARAAASRAQGASPRARVPPVDYGDKLPPSPWDNFTPPRRYIISPP